MIDWLLTALFVLAMMWLEAHMPGLLFTLKALLVIAALLITAYVVKRFVDTYDAFD